MELFWYLVTPIVVIAAVLTIIDIVRKVNGGGAIAGWIALVVIVPIIGPVIYWATRRGTPADAEQAYLAEQERRVQAAHKPMDRGF